MDNVVKKPRQRANKIKVAPPAYLDGIDFVNTTRVYNLVAYKRAVEKVITVGVCCRHLKDANGRGIQISHGVTAVPGAVDFIFPEENPLLQCGWTEATFNDYINMIRSIDPRYIPMFADTTWDRPVMTACSESAVARFAAFCLFRAMWENPRLGHILLNAHYTGKLHPMEYFLIGGLYHSNGPGSGHWCCRVPPVKMAPSVNDVLAKIFSDNTPAVTHVDHFIGMSGYDYYPLCRNTYKAYADIDGLIKIFDTIFWKGERHVYMPQ